MELKGPTTPTGKATVVQSMTGRFNWVALSDRFARAEQEARVLALNEVLTAFGPDAVEDFDHARWTYAGIADVIDGLLADSS